MSYPDEPECARCNATVTWEGDLPEDPEDFLCDPCVRQMRLELKARVTALETTLAEIGERTSCYATKSRVYVALRGAPPGPPALPWVPGITAARSVAQQQEDALRQWRTSDEGKTHSRLTSIVDENLGYRPTMPIEKLLDALETELPALKAKADKFDASESDQPEE